MAKDIPQIYIGLLVSTIIISACIAGDLSINNSNNDDLLAKSNEVDPCEACRLVVKSFEKGMEETSRGKHEGGDTSWEEKNLKSYADSEIRLVEIQENLCEDVKSKGKAQCLSLAEDSETEIEGWWYNERAKNVRLYDFLCISKLKRCCISGKFGPNCQPCPSSCNRHGLCDGDGTRLGTGICNCDPGYAGKDCEICSDDYFRVAASDHFNCLECDLACKGCFGPGKLNCTACKDGYSKHETNGCIDINECDIGFDNMDGGENPQRLCKGNTYCVNTDGSYKCKDCHESCNGCIGFGPDLCLSCAIGYNLGSDYVCRNEDELFSQEAINKPGSGSKYFFYAGILGVSIMMFGFRSNMYFFYTFLIGFIVFLILNELDLLDEMSDYSSISSE